MERNFQRYKPAARPHDAARTPGGTRGLHPTPQSLSPDRYEPAFLLISRLASSPAFRLVCWNYDFFTIRSLPAVPPHLYLLPPQRERGNCTGARPCAPPCTRYASALCPLPWGERVGVRGVVECQVHCKAAIVTQH